MSCDTAPRGRLVPPRWACMRCASYQVLHFEIGIDETARFNHVYPI